MLRTYVLFLGATLIGLVSCSLNDRNESNLKRKDIEFIKSLNLLAENEQIEMFESSGGFKGYKQSGNFISNQRLASYWIEDDEKEINHAFYHEIDSINEIDLISKLTYASYLKVYKSDGSKFNVYVDADSARTYAFFDKAQSNWKQKSS